MTEEARLYRSNSGCKTRGDSATVEQLILHLGGPEKADLRRFARKAIRADAAHGAMELGRVVRTKYETMGNAGALQLQESRMRFDNISGPHRLKERVALRRRPFLESTFSDQDRPKDILMFGVQQSGKRLAVRALAGE